MISESSPNGRMTLHSASQPSISRAGTRSQDRSITEPARTNEKRALSSVRLDEARLASAKRSFNSRRLDSNRARRMLQGDLAPRVGDLVLARVEMIGHHAKLQTPSGRRSELYVGDEIIVAYGDRYATNQWEARVPANLGQCNLAAAGGLAAQITRAHPRMKDATVLQPLGLLADASGRRINLAQLGLPDPGQLNSLPPVIVVLGTSMDSGKTTSAAAIVHGLKNAGLAVGAAKVTGTGACGDLIKYEDAGAAQALDFVDAGLPTTYLQPRSEIQRVIRTLLGSLASDGMDAIVVEVADGLLQGETADLLESSAIHDLNAGIVFASQGAIAALDGERRLLAQGYDVRAISGILSASPLGCEEAALSCTAPVYGLESLMNPQIAMDLLRLDRRRKAVSE